MKHLILFLLMFVLCCKMSIGQEDAFYLQLSKDTVLSGNVLEITFTANNVAGKFEGPELKGMNIISGPNTSTSMTMVNGEISQYASYSYSIYLDEIGEVIIPPAYLDTAEGTLETEPTSVIILPNPEGIIEQNPSQSGMYHFSFPNIPNQKKENKKDDKSKKKKRKLRKI